MFAYYTDLNVQTPNDVKTQSIKDHNYNNSKEEKGEGEEAPAASLFGENKAYTMLL